MWMSKHTGQRAERGIKYGDADIRCDMAIDNARERDAGRR
jgi:hypothetical protein